MCQSMLEQRNHVVQKMFLKTEVFEGGAGPWEMV